MATDTKSKKEMISRIGDAKKVAELLGLFKNRNLAEFILNVVEDGRIDHKNRAEYPGFDSDYERILNSALARRPSITSAGPEALAEVFLQEVIAGKTKEPIPPELESVVKPIVEIARTVQKEGSTINDSINATIKIYGALANGELDKHMQDQQSGKDKQENEQEENGKSQQGKGQGQQKQGQKEDQEEQEGQGGQGKGKKDEEKKEGKGKGSSEKDEEGEEDSEAEGSKGKKQERDSKKQGKNGQNDADKDESSEESDGEGDGKESVPQMDWSKFAAPKKFSHHGENNWNNTKVAEDEAKASEMKEKDDAKARAEEEKKKQEAADIKKATAKLKEGGQREEDGKPDWKKTERTESKYPEYDRRSESYVQTDHKIVEKPLGVGEWDDDKLASTINRIKRLFSMLKPEDRAVQRKQYEGDDIDVEAYLQYLIDRRCGMNPEPRYFTRTQKDNRSVATLMLVDMSGSTSDNVTDDKEIIDVEKEALMVIAHALKSIGDTFAMCGFSTTGGNTTEFYNFKSFASTSVKIPDVRGDGTTRIGPAIRHSIKKILKADAKTKILIVLTDGKPFDHDGYGGEYGIEDTKKAIEEARKAGIKPFGIIIGDNSRKEFERMYGEDMIMLKDVLELPDTLLKLYKRMTIG